VVEKIHLLTLPLHVSFVTVPKEIKLLKSLEHLQESGRDVNREIVSGIAGSIYPLIGDVTSTAGNNRVTVTGLEGIPLTPGPYDSGVVWQYVSATNTWQPILRAAIQVNGVTVSDDYEISVNVTKQVLVNGS
jgi:hypothetical protein